ncbi:sensor histidine kinase [Vibrio europaeus]|uniref:ATP-binding protein n=1 Tax=Vibrio europaeus TaxID=300876 RepID=UPI00233EAF3D|nr:DUF3404 domain-containing protein [Vibrio europaeus]MDC5820456.1 sensor histidine kinase [Vibrio europaeus]MDC5870589.1 sensor histidine kinase [Vibrio europaeus]
MPLRLYATFFFVLFAFDAKASLQQTWQQFYQSSWSNAQLTLSQEELSRYPSDLLISESQYPDFSQFSWADIEVLSTIKQQCQTPSAYNPALESAVEFELYVCNEKAIPDSWFQENPKRHPAGGTFVDRYFESIQPVNDQLVLWLSGDNPSHPLRSVFNQISDSGRNALLKGYRAWLEPDALWLNGEQGWRKIPNKDWQPVAQQFAITINGNQCDFRYSNLCIAKAQSNGYIAAILTSIFSLVLALLLARTLYLKRQQNRNKRFILQLLTHELRTPIASLGMTVDLFRQEFDSLNENSQQAMWRLLEDYQRLAQLTEASKGYLSSKESYNDANQEAYLSEWLEHTCSGQGVDFYLDEDKQLTLPFYWLTICLNNLIMNAKQHGKAPITIHVSVNEKLCITVTDAGQFPSYWNRIRLKQNTNQDSNMGIGLSLVRHLMSHLGGKVIINTNPTRITLELPL